MTRASHLHLSRRQALLGLVGGLGGLGSAQAAATAMTVLRSLSGADGTEPMAPPVPGPAQSLWGTTSYSGALGQGTIYRIDAAGQFQVMHAFAGELDGATPYAGLTAGAGGRWYGVTLRGGSAGYGVVFVLHPGGRLEVLHHFGATPGDGKSPRRSLSWGPDGRLYGCTFGGGVHDRGTVFAIAPDGAYQRLHDEDGSLGRIDSELVPGADGALYASASWSGYPYVQGRLLRITTAGEVSVLHHFAEDGTEGAWLQGLTQGRDGWLYGVSNIGGLGYGCLYRVSLAGEYQLLYRFTNHGRTGHFPEGSLVEGTAGHFYGVCRTGGSEGVGTIFHLRPDLSTVLHHAFSPLQGEGRYPTGGLRRGPGSVLLGATEFGGSADGGTVYRLAMR